MMQELGCFSFYFYRLQNLKKLNIAPMHNEEKNLQLILEMFPKSSWNIEMSSALRTRLSNWNNKSHDHQLFDFTEYNYFPETKVTCF